MNPSYQQVFERLEQMQIPYEVSYHPAGYTVEDMKDVHLDKIQYGVKNLFLRDDNKERYFLVVVNCKCKLNTNLIKKHYQ